jgi:hypothetical protein
VILVKIMATTPKPEMPLPAKDRLYKIRYKRGQNPDCWSLFDYAGELPAAIVAGRDWCHKNDFKFIHVELAKIDLQSGD